MKKSARAEAILRRLKKNDYETDTPKHESTESAAERKKEKD